MIGWILDTSSSVSFIALSKNGIIIDVVFLDGGIRVSKEIFEEIDRFFLKHSLSIDDLSYISCGAGPGSYTGIRVGAIIAKSFAYSKQKPLISFSALYSWVPKNNGCFLSLLDAKLGGVYLLAGEKTNNTVTYFAPPKIVKLENLHSFLENDPEILTPDLITLQKKIPEILESRWISGTPDVQKIAIFCHQKYLTENFSCDGKLNLLYLQNPH